MISSVEAQFISLIISTFAGIAIGLLFDLYRVINYYARPQKNFQYFMDLLFWVITGIVVFMILLQADFGMIRAYTFAGISIGVFLYFKLFTIYVIKIYIFTINTAVKVIRIIIIFAVLPFKLIYNLMWIPANYMKKIIIKLYGIAACKLNLLIKRSNEK